MTAPVKAIGDWKTNAELIADCARLGYLRREWSTLDPTYGYGTFWQLWQPDHLVGTDIDPTKSNTGWSVDFTALPFPDQQFGAVVFDPPYKLNGRATDEIDERYGVHVPARWQDRMQLIADGVAECCRVSAHMLLVKCQDQVVSGKKRWQTDMVTAVALEHGFGKVDRFDFPSYRPQPPGRQQRHAAVCSSQLLVFRHGWETGA